jgi:chromosome segregation protein
MLKRLELVGFKSFAEKTLFDFSGGITAIVGPNGSGKSNIVDAVRWVLGEQSAKSLRGDEMADVIFQGSTTRRSQGMAEVTLTFDNGRRTLATEAEEVQITRRVYRGGEGEYLVNQQPSRLKDIKQLFLGSGAGTEAYSIIEQGRVDVLLQASTKDRRSIFEEAAGISRFKLKKIETLRKLERTDLNLQRLKDIIEEVEKQLRSVKLQASKAQRYREYSDRLKDLRIGLGLQDYHQLAGKLDSETGVLDELRAQVDQQEAGARNLEDEVRRVEDTLQQLDATVHDWESRLAAARQQIAAEEATSTHEASLSSDLESDVTRTQASLGELSARVAALAAAAARAADEWHAVDAQCGGQRDNVRRLEEDLQASGRRLAELHAQVETDKNEHVEQMRQMARLQNDAVSHKAHLDNLARECDRLRHKSEQAAEHLASLDVELLELSEAEAEQQSRLTAARQDLIDRRQERDKLRQLRDQTTQRVADLRAERSGLASRIEILEGLERSHEGLGAGVREVLELVQRPDPGPWRTVRGMIADLLTVRREYAPLIDLALGDLAQRFLVNDAAVLHDALRQHGQPFSGRVSFLPAQRDRAHPLRQAGDEATGVRPNRLIEASSLGKVRMPISAEGVPVHPGIIGLAAPLVSCVDPDLAHLPDQLLGQTLLVRDLDAAREIAAYTSGYRFVTLSGELLEADGSLTVGTHRAETGILSRKSELREFRDKVTELDARIAAAERELAEAREHIAAFDSQIEQAQQEIDVLAEQAADLRTRIGRHRQRREGLHEEVALSRTEISGIEREMQELELAWQQARDEAARAEARVQALQESLRSADAEIRSSEEQRQTRQEEYTKSKVTLGQVEERLAAVRAKHEQIEADLDQRRRERQESEQRMSAARHRLAESQRIMLRCTATLAQCYLDKEAAERQLTQLTGEREQRRHERQALADRAKAVRDDWRAQQEQAHARELEVSELRHRRDSLVERLREDYQIDLAELYQNSVLRTQRSVLSPSQEQIASEQVSPQQLDAAQANEEIAELRRKLSRLGSVNLDALQELAELEARASALHTQLDDLTAAQRALQEIIAKINHDSRKLFSETFNAIRVHFQELFRKLFGGGQADTVLEDENDILESGIEIIARPPGKELRSISLMSGGEKTLTAVALLLAIFRSKPSPFCILDEVDAALDEANIGRFTAVLREFLDHSQFIIITHSKRTMAVADVLYGITMQESGISKRVAVRFEDYREEPEAASLAQTTENGSGNGLAGPHASFAPAAFDSSPSDR